MKKIGFTLAEVLEARQHIRHWSKGFTLAEVLITLAIIGIVAALTIPTLVQNYQTKAWNTASEVFQRKLEESLKVMNVQGTLAGYTTTEAFVDELSKHIKITRICDNDDITTCFADKVTWSDKEIDMLKIKTSTNLGQKSWDTNTVAVQFANGVNGVIAYNPECRQDPYSNQINGTSCLAILYDVDGFKGPNTADKDINNLNVNKLANLPKCSIELSDGTCFTAPSRPSPLTTAECEQLIADGLLDNCWGGSDWWGGAFKACNDMGSSLPSQEQLDQLARDLYPGTTIYTDSTKSYGNRDNDLAVDMGFLSTPSFSFMLWSNETHGEEGAYYRAFYSTYTSRGSLNRISNILAVCLAE